MARPRSPEPKKVLKRHSDGTTWAYFYDRDTKRQVRKEQIGGEQPPAKPGPAKGSIAALVADYKASNGFTGARPRTQEVYTGTLNQIVAILGNDAAKDITPARIQILMQEYKDQPYKANDLVSILSILFSYAIKNWPGFSVNPAANPEKYHEEPRTQIWSEEAERVYGEQLRPSLRLLFGLLLYTLQRLSDVLEMTKDQVVDHKGRLYIVLVQQKTGALMSIPVHANLEAPLRERLATKIMHDGTECKNLIASPQGHPWTRRNASRAWDHDIAEARANRVEELRETGLSDAAINEQLSPFDDLQRRDLRRTGAVRLTERGATVQQIAALSGWSIDYTQKIVDVYVPRRSEVAAGAMNVWENNVTSVIRLPDSLLQKSRDQRTASLITRNGNSIGNQPVSETLDKAAK